MKNRKCAEQHGLLAELFEFGREELPTTLLEIYNEMLRTGCLEPRWHTFFSMLLKSGDLSQAGNWRPIANLDITYNVLS